MQKKLLILFSLILIVLTVIYIFSLNSDDEEVQPRSTYKRRNRLKIIKEQKEQKIENPIQNSKDENKSNNQAELKSDAKVKIEDKKSDDKKDEVIVKKYESSSNVNNEEKLIKSLNEIRSNLTGIRVDQKSGAIIPQTGGSVVTDGKGRNFSSLPTGPQVIVPKMEGLKLENNQNTQNIQKLQKLEIQKNGAILPQMQGFEKE